ncbi:MAG TPA: hypothetical protein VMS17_17435, partial [Gemmataceae bacterium]|nr:hypothetical protein [Gemmataceae bacterium]
VGGSLHLVIVIVAYLAPIGFLARALRHDWLPYEDELRFILLAVPGLWLLFPIALFSTLSGSSRWFVFRPVIVWRLLRVAPSTLTVYFLSALLAAGLAVLVDAAVARGWWWMAPVVAPAASAALLIYARLLGRLAARMGRLPTSKRKTAKKKRKKVAGVEVQDPWAVPEESEPPEPSSSGPPRRRPKGYGLAAETAAPPPPQAPPSEADREIRDRPKRVAPPISLLGGVFTFPWYRHTRKAWLLLSAGFLAAIVCAASLAFLYVRLFKDY